MQRRNSPTHPAPPEAPNHPGAQRSHWAAHPQDWWKRIGPPLRPTAAIAQQVAGMLANHRGPTLLLGVTPELAVLESELIALDRSAAMIDRVWPGNSATRKVVQANWLKMPIANGSIAAAIGDGSVNTLSYPDQYAQIFGELSRALGASARVVLRLFEQPAVCETIEAIRDDAMAGRVGGFSAFRWRLSMAIACASGSPNIAAQSLIREFDRVFPDRAELAARCGWTLDEIALMDVYRGSTESFSFPTAEQFRAVVGDTFAGVKRVERVATAGYELCERCPLFVIER